MRRSDPDGYDGDGYSKNSAGARPCPAIEIPQRDAIVGSRLRGDVARAAADPACVFSISQHRYRCKHGTRVVMLYILAGTVDRELKESTHANCR